MKDVQNANRDPPPSTAPRSSSAVYRAAVHAPPVATPPPVANTKNLSADESRVQNLTGALENMGYNTCSFNRLGEKGKSLAFDVAQPYKTSLARDRAMIPLTNPQQDLGNMFSKGFKDSYKEKVNEAKVQEDFRLQRSLANLLENHVVHRLAFGNETCKQNSTVRNLFYTLMSDIPILPYRMMDVDDNNHKSRILKELASIFHTKYPGNLESFNSNIDNPGTDETLQIVQRIRDLCQSQDGASAFSTRKLRINAFSNGTHLSLDGNTLSLVYEVAPYKSFLDHVRFLNQYNSSGTRMMHRCDTSYEDHPAPPAGAPAAAARVGINVKYNVFEYPGHAIKAGAPFYRYIHNESGQRMRGNSMGRGNAGIGWRHAPPCLFFKIKLGDGVSWLDDRTNLNVLAHFLLLQNFLALAYVDNAQFEKMVNDVRNRILATDKLLFDDADYKNYVQSRVSHDGSNLLFYSTNTTPDSSPFLTELEVRQCSEHMQHLLHIGNLGVQSTGTAIPLNRLNGQPVTIDNLKTSFAANSKVTIDSYNTTLHVTKRLRMRVGNHRATAEQ